MARYQYGRCYVLTSVSSQDADFHIAPTGHDPMHCSRKAKHFFESKLVAPESLDLNPIENLWHERKEHLWAKFKPRNLDEQGLSF